MPRILLLTTLPHSRPTTRRFERTNGRYSLRLEARRSIGLPYGLYPRLILIYLTTQAIRTKSREIELGRTPSDFARKLGLTPISGPRGTAKRLHDQLHSLVSTRFHWQYSKDFRTQESGRGLITSRDPALKLLKACLQTRRPTWKPELVFSRQFFHEITRSAVPVDLRAIETLKGSPLAIDIYIWLTYRMSYLSRPCLIPWKALELQFGATYARSRDFQRSFCTHLHEVVGVYHAVRLRQTDTGLLLYPSPPHVQARTDRHVWGNYRQLASIDTKVQRVR
ncbi:MAG: replication protein RepA [Thermoanaerobaculia bacterium]